ncbi:MAG: thiamine phosphate synthase [Pseudomonadota bacterium]
MPELANRCRLVLNANPLSCTPEVLKSAAAGGDVASCILYQGDADPGQFDSFCKSCVGDLQSQQVAVLIADDTQLFGRTGADGLFLEKGKAVLADNVARFSPHSIVGCGGIKNRHTALEIGEARPDVVLFGKLGGDIRPEPHPKNVNLAEWWAQLVEVPAILLAGNEIGSVIECAETGVDFVALESAVFGGSVSPSEAVALANQLLDEHAPDLSEIMP